MLLVAVFVLTNTVSADGSISGVYSASLRLAEQSSGGSKAGIKEFTDGLRGIVGRPNSPSPTPAKEAVPAGNPSPKSRPSRVPPRATKTLCTDLAS